MRTVYEREIAGAREIEGQILSGTGKIVRADKFKKVCEVIWPGEKLAPKLADIAGCDIRTASRWLSGEYDPPICVVLAIVNGIFSK